MVVVRLIALCFVASSCLAAGSTPEQTIEQLWQAFSHPPGVSADTQTLQTLFHPQAMVFGSRYRQQQPELRIDNAQDFVASLQKVSEQGFYECEISRSVERQDRFAQVYSVVESRRDPKAPQADFVGVNSIQLYQTDKGWQILSLYYHVDPDLAARLSIANSGNCLSSDSPRTP